MAKVIIVGSARKDGNTVALVNELVEVSGWKVIHLSDYNISHYDYDHLNRDDDYINLMKEIVKNYDTLIFATPVYWYSMSGVMKVFFDRLSDLVTIEKGLGRMLKGKKMAVITCSHGNNLGDTFWLPFTCSAEYLEMEYVTGLHTIVGDDDNSAMQKFVSEVSTCTMGLSTDV